MPNKFGVEFIPENCYQRDRPQSCVQTFAQLVSDVFAGVFGRYNPDEKGDKMNLTTLLISIINTENRVGINEAYSVIERISKEVPDEIRFATNKMKLI